MEQRYIDLAGRIEPLIASVEAMDLPEAKKAPVEAGA
jgi:hypothetical protein